jgi:hypothetical protein
VNRVFYTTVTRLAEKVHTFDRSETFRRCCVSDHVKRFSGQCNRMHETFQWSRNSNLLKRFSGLYMGTNTYVSEYTFGPTLRPSSSRCACTRCPSSLWRACQGVNKSAHALGHLLPDAPAHGAPAHSGAHAKASTKVPTPSAIFFPMRLHTEWSGVAPNMYSETYVFVPM